ncbi:MAG: AlkZ family DNA glycosylase [Thermomicrobiales bacterium]|nr:AlkZ family DNA glycosylase [Thermomicrobiales bacterium]
MSNSTIAVRRLANQRLIGPPFQSPVDAVSALTAVQAQDYAGACWALAQRSGRVSARSIDQAFDDGQILRTHVMRPTWHFVRPDDIGWLLKITGPRVHAINAPYYRKFELDESTPRSAHESMIAALVGGNHLTRQEIAGQLQNHGIAASGPRLAYIMMHAELEAVICSGPRRGKQFTYALLAERAPGARRLSQDEAIRELVLRYFTAHGPATVRDCAWWSGLTIGTVERGVSLAGAELEHAMVGGARYLAGAQHNAPVEKSPVVHLLPNYDEQLIAYRDHSVSFDPSVYQRLEPGSGILFAHIVTIDGLVVGGWRRTVGARSAEIVVRLLRPLESAELAALDVAVAGYAEYLGVPVNGTVTLG